MLKVEWVQLWRAGWWQSPDLGAPKISGCQHLRASPMVGGGGAEEHGGEHLGGVIGQAWKGLASFLHTFPSRGLNPVTVAAREAEKCKVAWQRWSASCYGRMEEKSRFWGGKGVTKDGR